MMIIWPSDTREIIDKIRDVIGRDITINVTISGIPCGTCIYDPVSDESTNPFCLECSGKYWKSTTSGWVTKAHIRWGSADRPIYVPGGRAFEGDCIITIGYSQTALANVEASESFIVDNKDMIMEDYILKGVPNINRITVALIERKG